MSALAKIMIEFGCMVSGSDIKKSSITDKLQQMGANICLGHDKKNVSGADMVIYSGCIPFDNPELVTAHKKNIPALHRAEFLGELMNEKIGIAVSGAHGKSTTTTIISLLLRHMNFDPTIVIGAEVENLRGGGAAGNGPYVVAEADESDGSFLFLKPTYTLITNIDLEHLDYYKDIEEIKKTYFQFMERTKTEGKLFYSGDNIHLQELVKNYGRRVVSFGLSCKNDIYPVNVKFEGLNSEFDVVYRKENLGRIKLSAGGEHNVVNCLGAVAFVLELGVEFKRIQETLTFFELPKRRCQIKARLNNIMVIDDYAHHPTEIKATLKTLKQVGAKRIIAVFQPHRYTRTKHLKDLFVESFDLADLLFMTDIYAACEKPIDGVDSRGIIEEIKERGNERAFFLPADKMVNHLLNLVEEGDIVVVLGAGDIWGIANELSQQLKLKFKI